LNTTSLFLKKVLIGGLVILITFMHLNVSSDNGALHVLHRELYFIPILLAAFWFGLNTGLIFSLLIGFLYSFYLLTFSNNHVGMVTVIPQVLVFVLVGTILGWLSGKRKKHYEKEIADNKIIILGRAASAVSHEMKDILYALKSMYRKAKGLHIKELDNDFEAELDRLSKMIDILSSYAKQEKGRIFSHDLNGIIKNRIEPFQKAATENGIYFVTKLDPDECPSWIDPNKISWVLDKLIDNAMEVSSNGNTIEVTTQRGGEYCTVSIKDEGPGIKPEHMEKIFKPFFTTKPNGQGLALAGCRKSIQDMGGNLTVKSTLGEGAEFIILVPRESTGAALAENTAKSVFHGHSDSQLYRE